MDKTDSIKAVLKAIRDHCRECCGGYEKAVTYCTCDGIHSTRCDLWPYRFGKRPSVVRRKYGAGLLDPKTMPDAQASLEDLPAKAVTNSPTKPAQR